MAITQNIIPAEGKRFSPLRESTENTAQLGAESRSRKSPAVPKRPAATAPRSPRDTTTSTPRAATAMPAAPAQPSRSRSTSQPRRAMKIGVEATIQAVVVAWAVTSPFDCSH